MTKELKEEEGRPAKKKDVNLKKGMMTTTLVFFQPTVKRDDSSLS